MSVPFRARVRGRILRRDRTYLLLHFFQQLLDGCIQFFAQNFLVANDALRIDDIHAWPLGDVPLLVNGSVDGTVPPAAPGKIFLYDDLFDFVAVLIAVYTQQYERLAGM